MKKEIEYLGYSANSAERLLYHELMSFENHINECNCDDAVKYDFVNTIGHYKLHTFCLNCGGHILPEKE